MTILTCPAPSDDTEPDRRRPDLPRRAGARSPLKRTRRVPRPIQISDAILAILSSRGDEASTVYDIHRRLLPLNEACPALSTVYRHIRRLEAKGRLVGVATRDGGRPMLGYRLSVVVDEG